MEQLTSNTDISVAYIYFDYQDRAKQSALNLAGSLLRQLLQGKGFAPPHIMALYNQHFEKQTRLTIPETVKLLHSECLNAHKIFIVIDALDESSLHDGTRDTFLDVLCGLSPTTRLMLTSRYDAIITNKISSVIEIQIRATSADISRYIERRLEKDTRLKHHIEGDADLKAAIISALVQNARGLYVPCLIGFCPTNLSQIFVA